MNNFDLGGQYLQVGRCITPPEALTYIVPSSQSALPQAVAIAAAAVTARIQAKEATTPTDAAGAGGGSTGGGANGAIGDTSGVGDNSEGGSGGGGGGGGKKKKRKQQPKGDVISRIKIKTEEEPMEKATFAPLPALIAPRDPNFEEETGLFAFFSWRNSTFFLPLSAFSRRPTRNHRLLIVNGACASRQRRSR